MTWNSVLIIPYSHTHYITVAPNLFIISSLKMAWVYGRKRSDFNNNTTTVKMNCFALKSVVIFLSFVILKRIGDSDSSQVYRRVQKLSKRIIRSTKSTLQTKHISFLFMNLAQPCMHFCENVKFSCLKSSFSWMITLSN